MLEETYNVCVVLLIVLISITVIKKAVQVCQCKKSGMVAYREIRDDPNHTSYWQATVNDPQPNLYYSDYQT